MHEVGASLTRRAGVLASLLLPVLMLLIAGGFALDLALHRFFQLDEFVFVRAAWLVGEGQVPYRDFFEHHTPLFYLLLAIPQKLFPHTSFALVGARLVCLPLLAALLVLVYRLARSVADRTAAALAVVLLATGPAFLSRAIEVRPDLLAIFAFAAAAVLLGIGRQGIGRRVAGGVLLGVAILSTQKAVHYVWGLALLPIVERWFDRERGRYGWATLAAMGVTGGVFAAALASVGAWSGFWNQNVELALRWQGRDPGFPLATFFIPALRSMPLWTAAVVAGALLLLRRSVREAMDGNAVRVVLAAAVPAAVSLVTLPAPWPYNFLPFFVAATPVAAVALECSTAWLRRARSDRAVRFAAVVIALVAGLALVVWGIAERRRDNGPQRELVDRVLRLTAPDEPVFDGNGAYLFRPAAYPIWYHSAPMRQLLARQFEQEMASTIVAHGAPLWILDPRYESLPPPTRVFLLRHFQRYFGPLHVWGERLDGSAEPEFLAVRDGRYFLAVRPEPAEGTLRIRVDGELRAPGVPFALAAGRHPIVREAIPPATEIYLLWLPADGRLWVPGSRPDLTMYPYDF